MSDKDQTKTVLGPDCKITGQMQLSGDATVMGQFQGELRIGGMLELTDSSQVKGLVIAGALRLGGKAQADIVAEHGMELLGSAELTGQLYTTRLSVVDGATFEGSVVVGPKALQAAGDLLKGQPVASTNNNGKSEPSVATVPQSLDDILQRRRSSNGNGNGKMVGAAGGNGQHHD